MASIAFFPPKARSMLEPKEWGTGKYKGESNIQNPRAPTWLLSGYPVDAFYSLTPLKLSNLRMNDQLLLKPQESEMGKAMINKPFPAEHPYTSHLSKFALFPKFDTSEDPKRGIKARDQQPINDEMPATAYDVVIKQKTKGFRERYELQALPMESQKQGLYWPGEHGFDQPVKMHGQRQQYYPMPPKTIAPNLQDRSQLPWGISERTAVATRNIEREQWESTYDQQFTGLGPSNPKQLDNLAEKNHFMVVTGVEENSLFPRSINTFDPARPTKGRIAKFLGASGGPLHFVESSTPENPHYQRKMTLTERENDRLWNGKKYVSLPLPCSKPYDDLRWKELDQEASPVVALSKIVAERGIFMDDVTAPVMPVPREGFPPIEDVAMKKLKTERHNEVQEIEAQNRFRLLESQTPAHDILLLNIKKGHAVEKELPETFYKHEATYNEERAGLYKTSYDPYRLHLAVNPWNYSPQELIDKHSQNSHVEALHLPQSRLSEETADIVCNSRTVASERTHGLSGDRHSGQEVNASYDAMKIRQKEQLTPTSETALVSVQEKEGPYVESEMGSNYCHLKFLQEHELPKYARNETNQVMSVWNDILDNVRKTTTELVPKKVQYKEPVVPPLTPLQRLAVGREQQPAMTEEDRVVLEESYGVWDHMPGQPPKPRDVSTENIRDRCTSAQNAGCQTSCSRPECGQIKTTPSSARLPGCQTGTAGSGNTAKEVTFDKKLEVMEKREEIPKYAPGAFTKPTINPSTGLPLVKTVFQKNWPLMYHPEPGPILETSTAVPTQFDPPRRYSLRPYTTESTEYRDNFHNLLTHLRPTHFHHSVPSSDSHGLHYPYYDLGFKYDDERSQWCPGRGIPRPQTVLLKLQYYDKTDANRQFHNTFSEDAPDLRENNCRGKKHNFWGMNAQLLHG